MPSLSPLYDQAIVYAAQLHRSQARKRSQDSDPYIPYVAHLLGVSSLVLGFCGSETAAIAALLHDALEDGPTYTQKSRADIEAEIQQQFGERVLDIVTACTDQAAAATTKEPWEVRKQRYIDHMAHSTDAEYLLVTGCDKLHNLTAIRQDYQTLGESLWAKFSGKKSQTLWYYQSLGDVLAAQQQHLAIGLVREYQQQLAWLLQLVEAAKA